MAAPGCVFYRTLTRATPGPDKVSSSSGAVCREFLHVVGLQRYRRDQGSSVYFHQAVLNGDDLYDLTLTDGDCRLQVTLDPHLNQLVERNILHPGSTLRNATFTPGMKAQLPACPGARGETNSYKLASVEVEDRHSAAGEDGGANVGWESLPWFGSSEPADCRGSLVPLRANRSVFLPLWNNVDYSGDVWRETPPTDEEQENDEEEQEEDEGQRPAVTVSELRDSFLSNYRGVARGVVRHLLIVRIINKSHLMFYGRTDRNCECPYKAILEVCDWTGSVCVVLWNSVCVSWYRCLKPGDIISLRCYRVKKGYQADLDDIEISVNSRNPAARISVLPESSVSPEYLPPAPTYNFHNSKELLDYSHGAVSDVIGLLTFSGRPERIRSKDGRGTEFLEYHWLRLEDGSCDQPIMVKLFSTSQPETHLKLYPLSVVVCTRLKMVKAADTTGAGSYLTNTTFTQVYCTGHHSEMKYRKLQPVRQFLQWLRSQNDREVLSRAVIGGSFVYPPPPVSMETYMKSRRGEPGFLRGVELQREVERLCYREQRTFCIQATVTMVVYSRIGEEDRCLSWTDQASYLSSFSPCFSKTSPHPSPSPSSPSSPSSPPLSRLPSTPRSFGLSLSTTFLSPLSFIPPSFRPLSCSSSSLPTSPSSAVSPLTPRPLTPRPLHSGAGRTSCKRKQLLMDQTPKKRLPSFTLQPEQKNNTEILFDAAMEFLDDTNTLEDDDDDTSTFVTAPLLPDFVPIAAETLPMRYDHTCREEQIAAVAMGGRLTPVRFDCTLADYYTLRLRALSDGVEVDVVFLPHSSLSSPVLHHSNTWTSILSHGAFSSHAPPPSPADLVAMAPQLTNNKLVCVLEACHLGGGRTELILSRAFHLSN
ncbi:RPA-related protein RADX isoform X1 [Channa argus]|uniref:RPA-related protein RADX isoform X1 n=1 Tax=Channa argus TaxID=215402 RepID=UPI003520BAA1